MGGVANTWLCSYVINLLVSSHQKHRIYCTNSVHISFDYCKFQIYSTHIYINPKRGYLCKERHKHVFLSMKRSNYGIKLSLEYNLSTPLIDKNERTTISCIILA